MAKSVIKDVITGTHGGRGPESRDKIIAAVNTNDEC
jgi:hypothetical protein